MLEITDQMFGQEVLQSDKLTIVDCWAPWCGPCKMMLPVLEKVSQQYADKVKFTKINVDENPDISQKLGIVSIPTIVFFKDGKEVDKIIGVMPEKKIGEKIDNLLA